MAEMKPNTVAIQNGDSYLKELNAFFRLLEKGHVTLSAEAIGMYRAILAIWNHSGVGDKGIKKNPLGITNEQMRRQTGLSDDRCRKFRKELQNSGFITFTEMPSREATKYSIISARSILSGAENRNPNKGVSATENRNPNGETEKSGVSGADFTGFGCRKSATFIKNKNLEKEKERESRRTSEEGAPTGAQAGAPFGAPPTVPEPAEPIPVPTAEEVAEYIRANGLKHPERAEAYAKHLERNPIRNWKTPLRHLDGQNDEAFKGVTEGYLNTAREER